MNSYGACPIPVILSLRRTSDLCHFFTPLAEDGVEFAPAGCVSDARAKSEILRKLGRNDAVEKGQSRASPFSDCLDTAQNDEFFGAPPALTALPSKLPNA